MSASVVTVLERLEAAERRLADHAAAPLPPGLTEPDPGGEERWEAGQVWGHVAEFPGFWLDQVRRIVATDGARPVPFGRTHTDPGRLAAIERDRNTDPAALLARVRRSLAEVVELARSLPAEDWDRVGLHPTRGEMTVEQILDRFIASHLEEHADQLDGLRDA